MKITVLSIYFIHRLLTLWAFLSLKGYGDEPRHQIHILDTVIQLCVALILIVRMVSEVDAKFSRQSTHRGLWINFKGNL